MKHQKGDIVNSLGTAIIIVLFMLICSSFSEKTFAATGRTSRYALKAEVHSDQVKDVVADIVIIPSAQRSSVSLLHNMNYDTREAHARDKTIIHGFVALQKKEKTTEPIAFCRFYYHLFPKDAEDLPDLS